MKPDSKRAAVAAYKERKAVGGIYALRCTASGETWVGRATDLETVRNRLAFAIRMKSSPHRSLLAAMRAHSEADFAFEELERFGDAEEVSAELRDLRLKKRLEHWRDALGAQAI